MITLTHIAAFRGTDTLEKARYGRYADTAENRRLHRVGQEYGSKRQEQEPLAAGKAIIVPDVPNSKKINIDKYLSPKLKKKVDAQVDAITDTIRATSKDSKEFMEQMSKLYKDEVTVLNEAFETLSKAKRAEMLYFAMRISNIVHGTNYMLSEQKKEDEGLQSARKENGNNKDILDALIAKGFEKSRKGEAMSFERADGKAPNPNFGQQGKAFIYNCQSCVVVYELRRRGFDVEAKGVGYDGKISGIQLRIAQNAARAFVGKEDSWYRAHGLSRFSRASKKAYTALAAEFMDRTKEPGRYTFSYKNRGYRSAHILCFERLANGDGFFYDPQSGLKYTSDVTFFESRVDVKYPFNTVIRVDNLDIKPEVAVAVCNLIKE